MGIDGSPWWLVAIKFLFLGVLQLFALLPVWAELDPEQPGASSMLFFMLLPYVLYPIVHGVGVMYELYDVDEWCSWREVCGVGGASAVVLPLLILLPIYSAVPMAEETRGMLLGFIIALPAIWIPVLVGVGWGPLAADNRQIDSAVGGKHQPTAQPDELGEMRKITAGVFFFVSIPLGFCVPVYLGVDHDVAGEAAMVFFALCSNVGAFQAAIAPRLGLLLHVSGKVGTKASTPEAIVKLLYGASLLPMLIMLPLYLHGDIRLEARRTLALFLLGLPPLYVLEAARVSHREVLAKLPVLLALLYFGLVMPVGILLPAWLAGEPDGTGKSLFLAFMMTPLALCLFIAVIFTWQFEPRLPFQPVDFFLDGEHRRVDLAYAGSMVTLPVVLLLPVYFEGELEDTPTLITISYMGIISGFLLLMFGISFFSAATPEIKSKDVLNLPYASAQEVLRTTRLNTDPFSPGRKTANSSRAAASLAALSPQDGGAYRDRVETGVSTMSGLTGFDDEPGRDTSNRDLDNGDTFDDDDVVLGGAHDPQGGRRESTVSRQSVMWGGWEVGMACKAEYPPDGEVYDATIVSLDWENRRAVVAYTGYDGDEHQVPITRLFSAVETTAAPIPAVDEGPDSNPVDLSC